MTNLEEYERGFNDGIAHAESRLKALLVSTEKERDWAYAQVEAERKAHSGRVDKILKDHEKNMSTLRETVTHIRALALLWGFYEEWGYDREVL